MNEHLIITLDSASGISLQAQIRQSVVEAILGHSILPGDKLPSSRALAKQLNKALAHIDSNYSVSVDGDTGMVVVRITDTETGEIVKQVPPQQVLDVSMSVEKIIGLLVNDQA